MKNSALNAIYCGLMLAFIVLCISINKIGLVGYDGTTNPFSAFDELFSVGEVYNILNASSLKQQVMSLLAGQGYIYGRIVFISDALLAYIPYKIFGLKGLVFAVRMAHAIYLLIGFHLINKYINGKNIQAKILSLLVFITFPVVFYFVGMPKPEPMQLLLIGLFFTFHNRSWAWLFLGLALGSKINIAFGCLYILAILLYQVLKNNATIKSLIYKMLFGFIGLIIALPAIIFAPFNSYFRNGLINIVTTASKPYDDPSIHFGDWVIKLFNYYYTLPLWFSSILVLIILGAGFMVVMKHRKYLNYGIFAILAILPIMLFTKRLWGHYLFMGLVMLTPFIFNFIHDQIKDKKIRSVIVFIVIVLFSLNIPSFIAEVKADLQRNSTVSFKEQKYSTLDALVYCQKNHPGKSTGIDIGLYYQYDWFINKNQGTPLTITSANFDLVECVIIPVGTEYPEIRSNYTLAKRKGICNIWVRN